MTRWERFVRDLGRIAMRDDFLWWALIVSFCLAMAVGYVRWQLLS